MARPLMENWHLIVGLGNPGAEYARTRHNAGFMLVQQLAERWRVGWAHEKKFVSLLARAESGGHRLILCQPQTYMNASGEAVKAAVDFYRVAPERTLVLVDDADLPLGQLRLRGEGSSGGHHGLDSVEQHLGTRKFARLRIGIGRRDGVREISGHVLGQFGPTDLLLLEKVLKRAADQTECWLAAGLQQAMNKFNGVVEGPEQKESM